MLIALAGTGRIGFGRNIIPHPDRVANPAPLTEPALNPGAFALMPEKIVEVWNEGVEFLLRSEVRQR